MSDASFKPRSPMSAARCAAWADAIGRFWQSMQLRGALDLRVPLDVIDLYPDRGAAVRPLLLALLARCPKVPGGAVQLRYLACTSKDAAWRAQPELAILADAGLLVPLQWQPGLDAPRLGNVPWQSPNPAVFLSHDMLHRHVQRLLALHYGRLFEGDPDEACGLVEPQSEVWRAIDAADDDASLHMIRKLYSGEVSSAPIGHDDRLVALVEQVHAAAPRGYLSLHAAPGTANRRALRLLGVSSALDFYRHHRALPVDFELLGEQGKRQGAAVWLQELPDRWVVQAAVGHTHDAAAVLADVTPALRDGDAGDTGALASAMRVAARQHVADADVVLALLRSARYDPAVFSAACPVLHERLLQRPLGSTRAWSQALRTVWSHVLPGDAAPTVHRDIALSAMRIADWSLAKQVWQRGMEVHGVQALDQTQLGWCHLRTGSPRRALKLVRRALAREPAHSLAREAQARIQERLAGRDDGWRRAIGRTPSGLVLEPIDLLHLDALTHQYRDPQIGVMSGLPALPTPLSDAGLQRWFANEFLRGARQDYAVVHADLGFVGHVGLEVTEVCASFAFWTGVDFRGQGYAGEAGRALCEFAFARGVPCIITSAYADNRPSLRALERIGFRRMPLRSTVADNPRTFLALTPNGREMPDLPERFFEFHRRNNLDVDAELDFTATHGRELA